MGVFNKKKINEEAASPVVFTGHAIYLMSDVLTAIGFRKFMTDMTSSKLEKLVDDKEEQMRYGKALLSMLYNNVSKGEAEINKLIEYVLGVENVKDLPFEEYDKKFDAIFKHPKINVFFQSALALAMKLARK